MFCFLSRWVSRGFLLFNVNSFGSKDSSARPHKLLKLEIKNEVSTLIWKRATTNYKRDTLIKSLSILVKRPDKIERHQSQVVRVYQKVSQSIPCH
jgi:hypothetical protein